MADRLVGFCGKDWTQEVRSFVVMIKCVLRGYAVVKIEIDCPRSVEGFFDLIVVCAWDNQERAGSRIFLKAVSFEILSPD